MEETPLNATEPQETTAPGETAPAEEAGWTPIVGRLQRLEAVLASHLEEVRGLSRDALGRAHAEADRLRDGAGLGALRPLLNEILSVRDDLSHLIEHYETAPAADPRSVSRSLDGLRTELDELLSRRGVVPIQPLAGRFDRETQRAVRFEPAADPADDLAVVAEVRAGFQGPAGVVRRADVVIRRHAPCAPIAVPQPQGAR